jgi:glycosyltransferase involved in cell wall biosynthesis
MNILLTNRSLTFWAGSETWVATMAKELSKEHTVHIYTGCNRLIPRYPEYNEETEYDIAIINHNPCLNFLKDKSNIKKKIFTSHGIMPGPEQPVAGADVYVAISEEVQANLTKRGYNSVIIRNPIDLSQYRPSSINETPINIAYLSNRQKIAEKLASVIPKNYTLKMVGRGGPDVAKSAIDVADIVITLGRGCYEALACNKQVIVADHHGMDGYVTPETILEYRKNNCSGRRYRRPIEEIVDEIKKYNRNNLMRDYIAENNNVEIIAKQYLNLI